MNKKYDKIYKGLRKKRIRKRIRIKPKNKKQKKNIPHLLVQKIILNKRLSVITFT